MEFLKQVLATLTGVLIAAVILFFGIMVFIGALVQQSTQTKTASVSANSVLYINLNHAVVEKTESNPFDELNIPIYGSERSIGLNDILARIKAAKTDDNIKGIYLNPSTVGVGFATLKAIRDALLDFKESKKFIVAYSEVYSQKAYYLASVADDVYLHPEGSVDFRGLSSSVVFLKDALDKLGIDMQVIKVGTYKSAVEPFMLNEMSPANREQVTSYLHSIYNNFLSDIASGRQVDKDSLRHIANEYLIRDADDALQYKFVDKKLYKDELLNELKLLIGIDEDKDIPAVSLLSYAGKKETGSAKDKVAVLYAYGDIVDGEGDGTNIGGDRISRELRKIRKDKDVKAVVLRVNSPGGSALASDVIWREVELTKQVKPIVVSMGDYAASGGYYISAAADSIFAESTTLTGSIGVFGIIPNFKGLLNNKLGVYVDGVSTGKYSSLMADPDRPLTAEERAIIQKEVDKVYTTFMERVANGRKITVAQVDSIGQGRVWTGEQAVQLGLVDKVGNLQQAITAAANKAELKDYKVVELPEKKDPFANLLSTSKDKIKNWMLEDEIGEYQRYLIDLKKVLTNTGIQARIPYTVEIY
ncbi:signal peptide peptidase SppA [Parapedobacter sp. SGR-10]|uniref:signal peptide peptidase SppA n=1 Tax=Parapedobacter sp. SGR-10 TaxID=2710879 RepID=UPI0013D82E66|nr:signal peptide peptidase SppA [Parapedobacter sp. SGR-10]NGF58089.1 signal peptide peptidase SppA [Parapedobacter sp. SGR-10]